MLRIFDFLTFCSLAAAAKFAVNLELENATYAAVLFVGILALEILAVETGFLKIKTKKSR